MTDPRTVPMVWALFAHGSERLQLAAVQMLGQIDGPAASNALAGLAIFSPAGQVRSRAIETLKNRDPRDVVGRLIRLVRKPFKYEVRHPGPAGSPGVLFAEGEQFNIERFYRSWLLTFEPPSRLYAPDVPFDPFNPLTAMRYTSGGQFPVTAWYMASAVGLGGIGATSSGLLQAPLQPGAPAHLGQLVGGMPSNAAAIINHAKANFATQSPVYGLMFTAEMQAGQRDWLIGRALVRVQASLEERLAMDVQFLEMTNAEINLLDEAHAADPDRAYWPRQGRRFREVASLVGRPARILLPIERAGSQTDLYRDYHEHRRFFFSLLLRRGYPRSNDRRPSANRNNPVWRSCLVARNNNRSARVSACHGGAPQSAGPHTADCGRR